MTDCPNCKAASERDWHQFTTKCICCQAREISRDPVCAQARKLGVITPAYKAELCEVAGETHWRVVHEFVRAWQQGTRPTFIESMFENTR